MVVCFFEKVEREVFKEIEMEMKVYGYFLPFFFFIIERGIFLSSFIAEYFNN